MLSGVQCNEAETDSAVCFTQERQEHMRVTTCMWNYVLSIVELWDHFEAEKMTLRCMQEGNGILTSRCYVGLCTLVAVEHEHGHVSIVCITLSIYRTCTGF